MVRRSVPTAEDLGSNPNRNDTGVLHALNTIDKRRPAADFLHGGGEMGSLIRSMDWSKTPLGHTQDWPQSLRTAVSLCISSNFPISLAWGPKHIQIYNDGYWPICARKHPHSMGQDFTECWASAWSGIGEAFDRALNGHAAYLENHPLFLDRSGYLEETFFTFSFSPIRDETGSIGGLFHPVIEMTGKILSERRARALHDLANQTGKARNLSDVFHLAAQTLGAYPLDLPFVLIYEIESETSARLAAGSGLPPGTAANPQRIDIATTSMPAWPLTQAMAGQVSKVGSLQTMFGPLRCGPYPEPPETAFLFPLAPPGGGRPIGILIAGVSTRLPMNATYRTFLDQVANTLMTSIANVRAYEDERRRAEALAEIDTAKTQFFSNISHEFRTPLTLMLGPVEDALADCQSGLPAVQRDRLEIVRGNALRLLKLVNRLLDFSSLEAGKVTTEFQPTDLARLTADLASQFQPAIAGAGLRLAVDCHPLPEPVYVDHNAWEMIVLNLLSNAYKFTLSGEIGIATRIIGTDAVLIVRDTGTGIAAHELPRLFERFHRIEGARGRTHEGSGIGLALVKSLVEQHGGAIGVSSIVGQGSEFRVRLPLGTAHLPQDRLRETPSATIPVSKAGVSKAGVSRAGSFIDEASRWLPNADRWRNRPAMAPNNGIFVVLAHDNADMRGYVGQILKDGGYHVCAVADGEAALSAIRQHQGPDVVIADVMMPHIGGFGLLQALRQDPKTAGIIFILLSTRAGAEARVEGLAAGADEYITKPFSAAEMLARLDSAIRLNRVRKEATTRELGLRAVIALEEAKLAMQRQADERFRLVVESVPCGIIVVDRQGDIVMVNRRTEHLFGYQRQELIGQKVDVLVPERLRASHAGHRFQFAAQPVPIDREVRLIGTGNDLLGRRKDGSEFPVEIGLVQIDAAEGPYALGSITDVTELKTAQETARRFNETLERQVVERTAQLAAANRDLDDFAYVAAHDLKAPLRVIANASKWLAEDLEEHLTQDARENIALMISRVRRMEKLLDDLLTYARIGRTPDTPQTEIVSGSELMDGILGLLALPESFQVNVSQEFARISVDRTPLQQVLLNLVCNAHKHHDKPAGRIDVTVEDHGTHYAFAVIDDGPGIPQEFHDRIFDLFQTLRPRDVVEGSGIGLAMVRRYVDSNGGAVTLESAPGSGSRFGFTWPKHTEIRNDTL